MRTISSTITQRPLCDIAEEIREQWANIGHAAQPYVDALANLQTVHDRHGADTGKDCVEYFLANARHFTGEDARRLKAELKLHIDVTPTPQERAALHAWIAKQQ